MCGSLTFLAELTFGGRLGIILASDEGFSFLIDQLFESFIVFIKSVLMFLLLATDDFLARGDDGLLAGSGRLQRWLVGPSGDGSEDVAGRCRRLQGLGEPRS